MVEKRHSTIAWHTWEPTEPAALNPMGLFLALPSPPTCDELLGYVTKLVVGGKGGWCQCAHDRCPGIVVMPASADPSTGWAAVTCARARLHDLHARFIAFSQL